MKLLPIQSSHSAREDDNPAIQEFLKDDSVLTKSFVREFFQNALDAAIGGNKVDIKFRLERVTDTEDKKYLKNIYGDILPILRQQNTNTLENDTYLVIEEFNTTGLIGTDEKIPDEKDIATSHWSNFSFGLLRQTKQGDSVGRNGVGKIVMNLLSGIRTVFYLTRRSTDNEEWLGGRAEFDKVSKIQGKHYSNWAWLTSFEDYLNSDNTEKNSIKFLKPVKDNDDIKRFKKIFNIDRASHDFGTSWVVPFPFQQESKKEDNSPCKDLDAIMKFTLEDFFWGILKDYLRVDFNGLVIDSSSVFDELNKHFPEKKREWEFIKKIHNFDETKLIEVNENWQSTKKLTNDVLPEDLDIEAIKEDYSDGELVGFKYPVDIKIKYAKKQVTEKSFVKVFLQEPEQPEGLFKLMMRKWLILSDEKPLTSNMQSNAMVYIDDYYASEFCAYAELPDHKSMSSQRPNLASRYANRLETLALIRATAKAAYEAINETNAQKYEDFLANIFGINIAAKIKSVNKNKKKRKQKSITPGGKIYNPPPPNYLLISESFSPFIVSKGKDSFSDYPVTVSVNCQTVDFFGEVDEFDIAEEGFKKVSINTKNCEILSKERDKIVFQINSEDFEFQIDGFSSKFQTNIIVETEK